MAVLPRSLSIICLICFLRSEWNPSIYPSINCQLPLFLISVNEVFWIPSSWREAEMHPEQITSPNQHKHTPVNRTFTPNVNLVSFMVSSQPNVHEGKPEKSERTMIERPESKIQPRLFFRVIFKKATKPR